MPRDSRERMIENLAVASAVGVLVLVVAAISLAAEAREAADERGLLVPGGAEWSLAGRGDDPAFCRVYRIKADSGAAYATLMSLRAAPGPAYLLGAVFSPKGELQSLRFVGGCAPAQVSDPGGLVDSIPGGDEAIARASDFVRGLEHARSGQGS